MDKTLCFYIYMYIDKRDNIPFYIGKGIGPRYKLERHNNCRQSYLIRKINCIGIENVKIHFLNENLSEGEAFKWETYWIKYIGRANKKEGSLCNLTDGGEGSFGHIQTEETKEKRRKAMLKLIQEGKVFGKKHREKISKGRSGIYHTENAKEKMRKNHNIGEVRKKLSENDVVNILIEYKNGITYEEIAEKYNVVPRHVYNIVKGYRWKHITKRKEIL